MQWKQDVFLYSYGIQHTRHNGVQSSLPWEEHENSFKGINSLWNTSSLCLLHAQRYMARQVDKCLKCFIYSQLNSLTTWLSHVQSIKCFNHLVTCFAVHPMYVGHTCELECYMLNVWHCCHYYYVRWEKFQVLGINWQVGCNQIWIPLTRLFRNWNCTCIGNSVRLKQNQVNGLRIYIYAAPHEPLCMQLPMTHWVCSLPWSSVQGGSGTEIVTRHFLLCIKEFQESEHKTNDINSIVIDDRLSHMRAVWIRAV